MNSAVLRYSSGSQVASHITVEKRSTAREYHVMDTTVCTAMLLMVTGATVGVLTPDATEMMVLLLLPLIGATVVTGGVILLNPKLETRKITMGRGLFGLLLGVPGPWALTSLMGYWGLTGLEAFFRLPPILILTGAACCMVAFIMSYPFCRQMYERADVVAKHEVRRLERMAGMPPDKPDDA